MVRGKILIVLTNHGRYGEENGPEKTGLWLSELLDAQDAFTKAGYGVELASPRGGFVPLDPRSIAGGKLHADVSAQLERTMPLSEAKAEDYKAVFFAGGHGTMWDFKDEPAVHALVRDAFAKGLVIGAVCHGVAALSAVAGTDGRALIAGRAVTGFSTLEEYISGKRFRVPYLLEKTLKDAGALYSRAPVPFTSYAVKDGPFVTGENPQSTRSTAELVVRSLNAMPAAEVRPPLNVKCTPCLVGTWLVGLAAVGWGLAGFLGGIKTNYFLSAPLFVLGLVGLGFLRFQRPFSACPRCTAAFRTGRPRS